MKRRGGVWRRTIVGVAAALAVLPVVPAGADGTTALPEVLGEVERGLDRVGSGPPASAPASPAPANARPDSPAAPQASPGSPPSPPPPPSSAPTRQASAPPVAQPAGSRSSSGGDARSSGPAPPDGSVANAAGPSGGGARLADVTDAPDAADGAEATTVDGSDQGALADTLPFTGSRPLQVLLLGLACLLAGAGLRRALRDRAAAGPG